MHVSVESQQLVHDQYHLMAQAKRVWNVNRQVTTVHVSPREPASPDVQVISYTGSTAVGRLVAADGAATLKRMNLELGARRR
jgi:acyl-CoA reductase-like NAD-dependent aldehyde dehydrogenase